MFQSLVARGVCVAVLCGALLGTMPVREAAALDAKAFAGSYSALVPPLSGTFYRGGADGITAVVKVAKNGKISGTWTTSPDGITDTGSVTVKGTISKITKGKASSKAKFTFTLSDGAKATGTLVSYLGGSGSITATVSKAGAKVSIAGARVQ